ncbi:M48 family metalloprotease [Streptomyces sp. NPDC005962]|uniref:M48 family metalloprotease n=1 Tax=Streptomyces sp. NPDC005962 TaxID=3154466 RepID=UPI0033E9A745
MITMLLVPLLVPFAVPLLAHRTVERRNPVVALWALTAAAVALALGSLASLSALLLAGALRLPVLARLGELIHPLHVAPGALLYPAAALSAVALTVCAWTLSRTGLRRLRQLRSARLRADARPVAGDLSVIDDLQADAYALPGKPGRIVVTTGMLRALAPAEREVLFAHERAHLAGRHHYFLAAADLAAHCHPALRQLRPAIQLAAERAADEAAAAASGDRRLTALAIGRAALASQDTAAGRPFFAPGATTGPVPRRVAALLRTPPSRHRVAPAVAVLLLLCTTTSALGAMTGAVDLHRGVEIAQGESAGG